MARTPETTHKIMSAYQRNQNAARYLRGKNVNLGFDFRCGSFEDLKNGFINELIRNIGLLHAAE
jgi:hypothetical protein